jgi:hypothetical protein
MAYTRKYVFASLNTIYAVNAVASAISEMAESVTIELAGRDMNAPRALRDYAAECFCAAAERRREITLARKSNLSIR